MKEILNQHFTVTKTSQNVTEQIKYEFKWQIFPYTSENVPFKGKSFINNTLLYTFLLSTFEFTHFIKNNSGIESASITTSVVSLTNKRSEYESNNMDLWHKNTS
jgi:hypothetical protein